MGSEREMLAMVELGTTAARNIGNLEGEIKVLREQLTNSPKETSSLELLAQAVLDGRVWLNHHTETGDIRIEVSPKDSPNGE